MGWIQSSGDRLRATLKTQFITGLVIVLPVALSSYIFAKDGQGIASCNLPKRQAHRLRKGTRRPIMSVDQMGHHLGIRFGGK